MLYVAAAIATVVVVLWGALKGLGRVWNETIGARQSQSRLINRLFPGANLEYVEAVLGPAALISHTPAGMIRRYRLLDCWISVGESRGASEWISITVTDPKFVFRTSRLTRELIDIRLGRDCFDKACGWYRPPSKYANIGQKEQNYVEVNDGPTTHRSQKSILGYTNAGAGELSVEGDPAAAIVMREKTTINTLAIARPSGELPREALLGWQELQAASLGRRRAVRS